MVGHSDCCLMDDRQDYRINTMTTWFDMIPAFGVVVTIAGISLKAGRIIQKLDNVVDDINDLKKDFREIKAELNVMSTDLLP